jgi:transcriptional regulator with XRE-family HTH domain
MPDEKIPERLKEARKTLNLNQIQIALDLDIQQKSISDIENGKIQNIPNKYIYYFYKKGISLDWIYDGKAPMIINKEILKSESRVNDSVDSLFDTGEQLSLKNIISTKQNKIETTDNSGEIVLYERIIETKDFNIRTLLSYIKSLENNLEYFKNLYERTIRNIS